MTSNLIDAKNLAKLQALNNPFVLEIVEKYATLCQPKKVTVLTGTKEDAAYTKERALSEKDLLPLATAGHLVHWDGYYDQGRDKENTKVLLPAGAKISPQIATGDRQQCLQEIQQLLDGIMQGKEMLVLFYCLGPAASPFSICALQITDSAYVAHTENMLYRPGYDEFKRLDGKNDFFYFVHSAGELENGVCKNIDKRRIYIDVGERRVFSVNTQYAGNSAGLKKLAMRLAINKAHAEGWLTEHMFIMGVNAAGKERRTYFTGAFPSACGKTSTAMLPGHTIIGDDIAYIKQGDDGQMRAVNAEKGIFGIIEDVNPQDDPLTYKALTTPREVIFSNVLVKDGTPYWLGDGKNSPADGINYAGQWQKGQSDKDGKEILPAHKNARFTIELKGLENFAKADDPAGVPISAIIYGGRDSETSLAVVEAFDWQHGVFMGAALESETTSATLGQAGVREHNPMSNLDFLVMPLGKYINNHLQFGRTLRQPPKVFSVNYFLKEKDNYLTDKIDKLVWLHWMEGRVHNEYDAVATPLGLIPKYEDVSRLFKELLQKELKEELYEKLFSLRLKKLLEKLERVEAIYRQEEGLDEEFFRHIRQQRTQLLEIKKQFGQDIVSPFKFY